MQRNETLGNIALLIPVIFGFLAIKNSSFTGGIETLGVIATAILLAIEASRFGAGQPSDLSKKGKRREGPVAWFFGTLLLWVICYPFWFHRRSAYGAKNRLGLSVLSVAVAILLFAIAASPGGSALLDLDSREVAMVKQGHLTACPTKTVEQVVNAFFGSPKWESGVGSNGAKFINITGQMTYMNKPVSSVIQFTIDPQGNSFSYQAFEMNGIAQNNFIAMALIGKICGN